MSQPSVAPKELKTYLQTIQRLEKQFIVQASQGLYRIGLSTEPIQNIYKLFETRRLNLRVKRVRPMRGANQMLRLVLRHAATGELLSGTDVSIEVLDAKTKKQRWSRKMHEIWDGYPAYVLPVALPTNKPFLLQVTVNPFPVARTQQTSRALRGRAEIRLKASLRGGQLTFDAPPKLPEMRVKGGLEILNAMTAVGGRTAQSGPFRLGFAIDDPQDVFIWDGGQLKPRHRYRTYNGEIIAFVQDTRTGMLIPAKRLKTFISWKNARGKVRSSFRMMPVYDGFASYHSPISMKPMVLGVEVRVNPALNYRFSTDIPVTFSLIIKKYFPKMKPKAPRPPRRR